MQNLIVLAMLILLFCPTLNSQIEVTTITEEFNGSGGLTIGPDGLLYIADFGESLDNGRGTQVWRLDYKNGGELELFAQGLDGASGNDFNSLGELFQSNIALGRISKITESGSVSTFVSDGISCSVGINIDAQDDLYVCNCCGTFGNTIRKVTSDGISTEFATSFLFNCPNGITRDSEDNLYVSNFGNGNILKITPEGQVSRLAITPGSSTATPSNGHITYSEQEDVLYVASHGSHRIYRLTLDGTLSLLAGAGTRGNRDGDAQEATFSRPNGLALSETGDTLFVNCSIPTTDVGGRPLNPSVVRMITGLRGLTSIADINNKEKYRVYYSDFDKNIHVQLLDNTIVNNSRIQLFTSGGKLVYSSNKFKEIIPVETSVSPGIYILKLTSGSGSESHKVSIY